MDATLLHIQPAAPQPIYRQIAEQIRRLVAGGQLAAGTTLPSVRDVAAAALGPARTRPRCARPPGARARTFAGRTACPAPPTDGGTRMNAVAQPAVAPAAPLDLSFAMEPPISVRGVDKRYDGQTVLAGANLQLEPGAVLGLIGRNGAGKST